MKNATWKAIVYGVSLLLIITGVILNWMHLPFSHLLICIGFTPYVGFKIAAFLDTQLSEWHWTDKIRFALALFMGIMLMLYYIRLYNSEYYFMLALSVDYIVGRQINVRQSDT
ncbi:MAG: hypothetical protein V4714_04820 [Bacteroidota bacterium]